MLRATQSDDFACLQPHLVRMATQLQQTLIEPNVPPDRLFFPESGYVSITTATTRTVEVGLVGLEGLVGAVPILLCSDMSPYRHYIQAAGEVLCIERSVIEDAVDRSASLRRLLLRYIHTLTVQMAQTAYVNATFDIETRLARWLLMCQDRIGGTELTLTHEFLSIMLGVQRTSVTLAVQNLEGSKVIRARRGRLEVRDRDALLALADEGYGLAEAEYARVIESA